MVGLVPQEIFDASVNPFREETVEGWRFDAGRSLSLRVVCRRGAGWRLSPWMTGWFRRMWERGKSFMQTTVQSGRGAESRCSCAAEARGVGGSAEDRFS